MEDNNNENVGESGQSLPHNIQLNEQVLKEMLQSPERLALLGIERVSDNFRNVLGQTVKINGLNIAFIYDACDLKKMQDAFRSANRPKTFKRFVDVIESCQAYPRIAKEFVSIDNDGNVVYGNGYNHIQAWIEIAYNKTLKTPFLTKKQVRELKTYAVRASLTLSEKFDQAKQRFVSESSQENE